MSHHLTLGQGGGKLSLLISLDLLVLSPVSSDETLLRMLTPTYALSRMPLTLGVLHVIVART